MSDLHWITMDSDVQDQPSVAAAEFFLFPDETKRIPHPMRYEIAGEVYGFFQQSASFAPPEGDWTFAVEGMSWDWENFSDEVLAKARVEQSSGD